MLNLGTKCALTFYVLFKEGGSKMENNATVNAEKKTYPHNDEDVIDLAEIFFLLLQHWYKILLSLLCGACVAYIIAKFFIMPTYTATSSLYISSSSADSIVDLSDLEISSQLKADYQTLITSPSLMEEVIDSLELDMTYSELQNLVTVENPSDTRILNISVSSTDPQLSADISNEIAAQAKIDLPLIMKTDEPYQFEPARVPTSASSPNVTKYTAIGALIGACACIAIIIIAYLLNDTFLTGEDINKYFNVQPLGSIREGSIPSLDQKTKKHKKSDVAERKRIFRFMKGRKA